MDTFDRNSIAKALVVPSIITLSLSSLLWTTPVSAHVNPPACASGGLGISLFSNAAEVRIGDVVVYTVVVFNGNGLGPTMCDVANINASLVTPDGVDHPITLARTSLSSGEFNVYSDAVSYTARAADVKPGGMLVARASDAGIVHQSDSDMRGSGNNSLGIPVVDTLAAAIVPQFPNTGVVSAPKSLPWNAPVLSGIFVFIFGALVFVMRRLAL